jgi:integrase
VSTVQLDRLGRPYSSAMISTSLLGRSPGNKGKTYPAEIYSPEEVRAIMRVAGRGLAGARMRAYITMLYRCGMRAQETLDLELRDVDFHNGTVLVRHGKGNKRGVIGIDDQALAVLRVWLDQRAALEPPRGAPVFVTITRGNVGSPLQYSQVVERLHELGAKAGLEKRVHPHGFRHTFAVELLREGVNPYQIMKLLRHSDLATTMRYLDHLMPGEVVAVARARTWEGLDERQARELLGA